MDNLACVLNADHECFQWAPDALGGAILNHECFLWVPERVVGWFILNNGRCVSCFTQGWSRHSAIKPYYNLLVE